MIASEFIISFEQAYGVEVASMASVRPDSGGSPAFICAKSGARFALKRRPAWITSGDFQAVLDLQERATAHGARIPSVVRTSKGDTIWQWNDLDLALHEWVEGEALEWTEPHANALGAAVGSFSSAIETLDAPQVADWSFPVSRSRWLPDTPEQLWSCTRYLAPLDLPTAITSSIDRTVDAALNQLRGAAYVSGFIHGDVHPLNAVATPGGAMLIDLDEMRWGHRIFDVAQGVAVLAGFDSGGARASLRDTWSLPRARGFLAGWRGQVEPTSAEILAFPSFLVLAMLRVAVGELDLDDPELPVRADADRSIMALEKLLREPVPLLTS